MVCFFPVSFCNITRRVLAVVLAFALVAGYGFGIILALSADDSILSMMRMASETHVSIVGLLLILLFPLVVSACAVYISQVWLLIPLALFKAAAFGYLSMLVIKTFSGAGWLIHHLMMFSGCLGMPVLCWFWFYAIFRSWNRVVYPLAGAAVLLTGIAFFDLNFVSPFLASLLS